jgi:hypothetical protein
MYCCVAGVQVFQDVLGVESFTGSEEAFAADALLLAYKEGNAEQIKAVVQVKALCQEQGCMQTQTLMMQHKAEITHVSSSDITTHCIVILMQATFELENDMVV